MTTHQILAMWCSEGFEYIQDYTAYSSDKTWAALTNQECNKTFPNVNHLILRAQFNPQRHYEIYVFEVEDGITETDIREWADCDPQSAADKIRASGHCLYSNRANSLKPAIV